MYICICNAVTEKAVRECARNGACSLEQLRFLENGISIFVGETPYDTVGVDTEEDLQRAIRILQRH